MLDTTFQKRLKFYELAKSENLSTNGYLTVENFSSQTDTGNFLYNLFPGDDANQ